MRVVDTEVITDQDVEENERDLAKENLDVEKAMTGFIRNTMFDEWYSGNFTGTVDDSLLAVNESSEKEVGELVWGSL